LSRLEKFEPDGLSIFTLLDGMVRGAVVSGTRMVSEMRQSHKLGVLETLALGQAYLCGSLLSATIKGEDRLIIRMDCSGALGGYQVETKASGDVRGFLFNSSVPLERPLESFDLEPFIKNGMLTVTRYSEGNAEPFVGQVELAHSRIAEDLTEYFLRSEQTTTSFSVGVRFDSDGEVLGAGGLYLQALPGADDEALAWIERIVTGGISIGSWFGEGKKRREFLINHFLFSNIDFLAEKPIRFFCPCERERFLAFLKSLPVDEREAAWTDAPLSPDGNRYVEISCHNCGSIYKYERNEFLP
jgi:molecular chaperone Hsp33